MGLINQRYGDKIMTTLRDLIHKCWRFFGHEYQLYKNGILYTMSFENNGYAYCRMQGKTYAKTVIVNLDNLFNPYDDIDLNMERIEKGILKSIQIWYGFVKYNDMSRMKEDYMWRHVEILN